MAETTSVNFDIRDVMRMLPHRYPFLLVDRVIEHAEGERVVCIKNVTYNENFFVGHFPELPTMPGVLILEALAQASGILAVLKSGLRADSGLILYFAGIDNCRFKRPVVPGDQLLLHTQLEKQKRDLWKFRTHATVNGVVVCEADMMCVLKTPAPSQGPA
ncbi:3-hydroxyacyl-[acyl-carrier-protein] dehydratase [Panacagrimonas perspica]|uniref:3-hydroxyacyl-[acyl-carrier-protein] dehydratase FabZ n=1 Tax=Panacagrimonas perspica TaxID=381431 RepID=A0A4R7PCG7_9GAMM|nr:3-hydroxyacyl-ACP dehydratase FabZ [Panacagrimonas perspica]TDU31221.1 3-hydroxyacyl-[acyl-carrier-protein] dehydratase [Panacagrimonas perspica]THD02576.1 3-hydroxyacyl-[acyl-carrier-protein] dehydratase FabZ [Panacagrimonas perspica]